MQNVVSKSVSTLGDLPSNTLGFQLAGAAKTLVEN